MFIAGKFESPEVARPTGDVQVAVNEYGHVKMTGGGANATPMEMEVVDSNGDSLDYTIPAPVIEAAGAAAVTSVNSQATNVTLLAASATRLRAAIVNTDANVLYIKYGATATTSDWSYQIGAGGTWDMPYRYTGIIDGIWAADGAGAAKITSLTSS